jgi:hypothetical protein
LTSTALSEATTAPQHPIGPTAPRSVSWNPVEIVYCRLTMTNPNDPSTARFDLRDHVIRIQPGDTDPVGALIRRRLSDPAAPVAHDKVHVNNDPAKGPLDVFVESQCYFLIEVDHALPWQFCTTQPCLTLKDSYKTGDDHHNFGLNLDATGRFAWFSVAMRSRSAHANAYNKQSYNIVLQSKGEGEPTIYVIDPDTTNQNDIPPSSST